MTLPFLSASDQPEKPNNRGGIFPNMFPPAIKPPVPGSIQHKAARSIGRFIKAKTPQPSYGLDLSSAKALSEIVCDLMFGRVPMKNKLMESRDLFDPDDPMLEFHRHIKELYELLSPIIKQTTWMNIVKIRWARLIEVRRELNDLSARLDPHDVRLEPIHHLEWLVMTMIQNVSHVLNNR